MKLDPKDALGSVLMLIQTYFNGLSWAKIEQI